MSDPQLPAEMQQVALDRDGIPHNIGWMQAATEAEFEQQVHRADDAWQDAMKTRPGRERGDREKWWRDRLDDEDKRRDGWTERDIARRNEQYARRAEREADDGVAGRVYRALYRLRDEADVRTEHGIDYWGKPESRARER